MIRFRLAIALALGLAGLSVVRQGNAAAAAATVLHKVPLTITSSGRVHHFRIEVARTEAEQARGLMFRTHIARNGGMIFPMSPPRMASFWMANCPIPEDMLFIRASGTIARIVRNTTPFSTRPISSGEPVAAVLELAGGRAGELGLKEGDRVAWRG